MGNAGPHRKRAVRLTPEALILLNRGLVEKWQDDRQPGKLTREARAEYLGVSVATSERILAGKGVDRSTLSHAFRCLGLAWDESCCEPLVKPPLPEPKDTPSPVPEPVSPAASRKSPHRAAQELKTWGSGILFVVAVSGALGLAAWKLPAPAPPVVRGEWAKEFNVAFSAGMDLFHAGRYAESRKQLDAAIEIARRYDSASSLSSALRLAADLDLARGSLHAARQGYKEAAGIRVRIADGPTVPALFEALGDVETRLGDFKNAKASLNMALVGFRKYDDRVGVAMASRNLGSLYYGMKDLQAAKHWFQESLLAVKGLAKPEIEMDVRGRQALVYQQMGRIGDARNLLKRCLGFWVARRHPRWIALSQYQLGVCEAAAGNRQEATALLTASKAGFEKVGDMAGLTDAKAALARLESKKGSGVAVRVVSESDTPFSGRD